MKCNRYLWRLHPSSQAIVRPSCSPPKAASIARNNDSVGVRRDVSSTKFSFRLNDDAYIRPKSTKELGVSGRIIGIYGAAKNEDVGSGAPPGKGKKRKQAEGVRVTVRQHCLAGDRGAGAQSAHCGTVRTGVRPSRLFPVYDMCDGGDGGSQTIILMTPDTLNYRQLAASHLRSSDKVLEIGCSTGECTALLVRRLLLIRSRQCSQNQKDEVSSCDSLRGKIVAFDTGPDMIERARKRVLPEFSHFMPGNDKFEQLRKDLRSEMVQFHKVDAIADPKGAHSYAVKGNNRKPDVILIDIGGNRELKGVVQMIQWVQTAFENEPPRLIIIKSEELVEEISKYAQSKTEEGELEGNRAKANEGVPTRIIKPLVTENGVVKYAQEWFSTLNTSNEDTIRDVEHNTAGKISKQPAPTYSHPMKAPLVRSPSMTPICRFHNYALDGCKKHNGSSDECPYDHKHCHWCLEAGHIAMNCHHSR